MKKNLYTCNNKKDNQWIIVNNQNIVTHGENTLRFKLRTEQIPQIC